MAKDKKVLIAGCMLEGSHTILGDKHKMQLQQKDSSQYAEVKRELENKSYCLALIDLDVWKERGFILYILAKRSGTKVLVSVSKNTLNDLEWYCQFEDEDIIQKPVTEAKLIQKLKKCCTEAELA